MNCNAILLLLAITTYGLPEINGYKHTLMLLGYNMHIVLPFFESFPRESSGVPPLLFITFYGNHLHFFVAVGCVGWWRMRFIVFIVLFYAIPQCFSYLLLFVFFVFFSFFAF